MPAQTQAISIASITLPFPAGTVISYMGLPETLPDLTAQGWILCDGRALDSKQFVGLYSAIKTYYGGDGNPNFNLPNLSGHFLRGVDTTGQYDPDFQTRTSQIAGNSAVVGPTVGSIQTDQVRNHQHFWDNNYGTVHFGDDCDVHQPPTSTITPNRGRQPTTNVDGGGSETRPLNTYVYFLIFAGLPQVNP